MLKPLLMIPGPVEVDSEVLAMMARAPLSHTSPAFIEIFGECLDNLRDVFVAPDGQPIVVAGSGTLAMELAVANLVEPGDRAVVIETGLFSRRMTDLLRRHGALVEVLANQVGDIPQLEEIEAALIKKPKILAVTHVDTSTGVVAPIHQIATLARKYQVLTIVDGVCAVAGQEFRQTDWDVDVCITGSQKALAVPPGLALVMARPRALEAFRSRKVPVASYYSDWTFWLPVMQAYQARKPSYFATPPVSLVAALNESVRQVKLEGIEARWNRHCRLSKAFKAGVTALGLRQVPVRDEIQAVTLTAMYYPEGVDSSLLGKISAEGVTIAGGVHPSIAPLTFRVGHMGIDGIGEVLRTLAAIEIGLEIKSGIGVAAAQTCWMNWSRI